MSIRAAVRIGRTLVRSALWHDGQCTWIGPARRDRDGDRDAYESLGPDLYAGTAGIAWFLAYLFSATGDSSFSRPALGAIRYSLAASSRVRSLERVSFYMGETGIAFAAIEVARRLGVEEIESQVVALLRDFGQPGAAVLHGKFDLIAGAAGAMAALPILSARLGEPRLCAFAAALGEKTIRHAASSSAGLSWRASRRSRERNLTGFSHGTAGIAHGLLEIYAATGDQRFRAAAEKAFAYERSWFDQEVENWPDFRGVAAASRSKTFAFATHWCHGAPGIALSRMRAWELLRDDRYRDEAFAGIRTTQAAVSTSLEVGRDGFCVCHGLAGNAEVLLEAGRFDRVHHRDLITLAVRGAREAEKRARGFTESPSLFLGLAGIGYLNLRLDDPRVPSLLLLRREHFG